MTLHLWKNSSAIAVLACFIACGSALAGPNSISVSPSIGGFSSMRTPDISMRSRDNRDLRGVIAPPESNAGSKKAKKTGSGNSNTKKATRTGSAAGKKIAAPVASTPPVTGVNLGSSPAGQTIEGLQGKIDVPALGAVQDAAVLPGALGTSGGDGSGLPDSPRDPASAGRAKTLPSFTEQASEAGGQDARAVARLSTVIHNYYVGSGSATPTPGERPGPGGSRVGTWTWDLGGQRKVEVQSRPDGDGFTAVEVQSGRPVSIWRFDRNGVPIWMTYHGGTDGSVTTTYYDRSGQPNSWETRDSQGRSTFGRAGPDPLPANPMSASEKGGSSGGTAVGPAPTAGTSGPGNTISKGGGNTTTSSTSSSSSSGSTASGSGSSGGDSNTTSSSKDGPSGNEISQGSPGNDIGPSKDSSQPAEGTAGNRNFFYEKGIVNPGDRPKQTARGSDDRNIPNASGVIIQRDGPATPQELKDAVTQEGLGGPQRAGSGGTSDPAASRFAQPPQGTTPGINSSNTNLSGSGVPEAGSGLIRPKPAD